MSKFVIVRFKKIISLMVSVLFLLSDFVLGVPDRTLSQYTLRPNMVCNEKVEKTPWLPPTPPVSQEGITDVPIKRRAFFGILGGMGLLYLIGCADERELPFATFKVAPFENGINIDFSNFLDRNLDWGINLSKGTLQIRGHQRNDTGDWPVKHVYLKIETLNKSYLCDAPIEVDSNSELSWDIITISSSLIPEDFGNVRKITLYYFPPDKLSSINRKRDEILYKLNRDAKAGSWSKTRLDVEWDKLSEAFLREHGNSPQCKFIMERMTQYKRNPSTIRRSM